MRSTEKQLKKLCKRLHWKWFLKQNKWANKQKALRITKESGKYKSWNGNIKLNKQKINFPKKTW